MESKHKGTTKNTKNKEQLPNLMHSEGTAENGATMRCAISKGKRKERDSKKRQKEYYEEGGKAG